MPLEGIPDLDQLGPGPRRTCGGSDLLSGTTGAVGISGGNRVELAVRGLESVVKHGIISFLVWWVSFPLFIKAPASG